MDQFPTGQDNVWNIYSTNNLTTQSTQPVDTNAVLQQNDIQGNLQQSLQQVTNADQLTRSLFTTSPFYVPPNNNCGPSKERRIFGVNDLPSLQPKNLDEINRPIMYSDTVDFNFAGVDSSNWAKSGASTTFSVNSNGKTWQKPSCKPLSVISPTYNSPSSSIAMATAISNPNVSTACSTSNFISDLTEVFGKSLCKDIPADPSLVRVNAIASQANSINITNSLLKIQKLQQQQQLQKQQEQIEKQRKQQQKQNTSMEFQQSKSSVSSNRQMCRNNIDSVMSQKFFKSKKAKDDRYGNTLNALKKAGLLDITLQTGELIKKCNSLQKDIDMLEEIVKVTKHLMTES